MTARPVRPNNLYTNYSYEYQAKQTEDGPTIHSYALELVSHVCNNPNQEVSSIDEPLSKYYKTPEEEPEHERRIRLQVSCLCFVVEMMRDCR